MSNNTIRNIKLSIRVNDAEMQELLNLMKYSKIETRSEAVRLAIKEALNNVS